MGSDDGDSRLPHASPFEEIRAEAEDGSEYWSARDLAKILGYTQYNKFTNAITRAEEACKNSGQGVSDHFTHVSEMVTIGSGAKRKNETHYEVGKKIRRTIEELGGTLPENLPTPKESIQQLQRKEQKQLQERLQPSLFEEPEKTDEEVG